jgi:hypothetical protein
LEEGKDKVTKEEEVLVEVEEIEEDETDENKLDIK